MPKPDRRFDPRFIASKASEGVEFEHSLDSATIEILNVATHYNLDPDVVERWFMADFTDRQEYMFIQLRKKAD